MEGELMARRENGRKKRIKSYKHSCAEERIAPMCFVQVQARDSRTRIYMRVLFCFGFCIVVKRYGHPTKKKHISLAAQSRPHMRSWRASSLRTTWKMFIHYGILFGIMSTPGTHSPHPPTQCRSLFLRPDFRCRPFANVWIGFQNLNAKISISLRCAPFPRCVRGTLGRKG